MNGGVLSRVLAWLRAGYPEGVPPKDYTPLLALLRRTLSAEELGEVVAALAQQEQDPVRVSQIRAAIAEVTSTAVGEEEVRRVAAQLAARGVALSTKAQRIVGEAALLREAEQGDATTGSESTEDANPIAQALRWLGAGYPEGVPAQDRVPILALLRRRLTDEEVQEVAEAVVAQSGADPEISLVDAQVLMMKTLGELPGEGDVERVRAHLEQSGRTLG